VLVECFSNGVRVKEVSLFAYLTLLFWILCNPFVDFFKSISLRVSREMKNAGTNRLKLTEVCNTKIARMNKIGS
jgi:hypothetical protein